MNCFQLFKKGEETPTPLPRVDEEICAFLGVEVHPTQWVNWWYDTIGMALACGLDWDGVRESFPHQAKIIGFLQARYEVRAWAER